MLIVLCNPHKKHPEGEWVLVMVPSIITDSKKIDFNKIKSIGDCAFEDTSVSI